MLIPLTSNEIRRLLCRFVFATTHTATHAWHWSRYRRRRLEQARAPLPQTTQTTLSNDIGLQY